jgi:hypothetical protein
MKAKGIPKRGEAHPGIAGVYADTVEAKALPESTDAFLVTVNYVSPSKNNGAPSSKWTLTTGAVVQQTQTNYLGVLDKQGNKIVLPRIPYVWQEGDNPNKPAGKRDFGIGTLEIYVPILSWRMTRVEKANPMGKSKIYTGKINAQRWQGEAPHTWLCSRIEGTTNDQGLTYQVNYEFMFREGTWDADLAFVDPDTGKPPPGVQQEMKTKASAGEPPVDKLPQNAVRDGVVQKDNGIIYGVRALPEIDFTPLNLEGAPPQPSVGFVGL